MVTEILRDSFSLYRRFAGRFIATAAIVFAGLDLFSALSNVESRRGHTAGAVFWGIIALVAWVVGSFWIQGAIVEAVEDVRDGRADMTIGQLYERVRPRLATLIGAGLLAGLGIAFGLLLFIIPGLYLLTRWIVLAPVIIIEKRSISEAFSRSNNLVRGDGWEVFALVLITGILTVLAQAIIGAVFSWLPLFLDVWIGNLIAHSLVMPFVLIVWTLLYHQLVARRVQVPPLPGPPPFRPPTPTTP
ncbi:glycerophosphoryl diester phosphodiesterase membrane domain-containing protein [Vitiosangium sp. GDMCC 1.1324]|uniref:glycerophosphoryl diester phosphodiesterase membrane domain-containing protein n=1 Tax=Vitiosangium sp. (strain GDMCC 1.1324) TaxID=2138576 RepID=UPI00130D5FAD|nr:glycerophosphoryl diester phosphodiesterase membrane domain-containing protein [Vitiosangium sp. GDMCC 1.1324]